MNDADPSGSTLPHGSGSGRTSESGSAAAAGRAAGGATGGAGPAEAPRRARVHLRAPLRAIAFGLLATVFALRPLAVWLLSGGDRTRTAASGARTFHTLCRVGAPLLGLRVRVDGGPLPAAPCVVAGNHVSWIDIPVLAWLADGCFVSRADVQHWPVVGWFSRLGGTLWIDRSRRRDAARASEDVEDALRRGLRVTVFLEGGVGDGTSIRPFRSSLLEGAAVTGTPCVGAVILYSLPSADDDPGAAAAAALRVVPWGEGVGFVAHALRLLSAWRIDAVVRLGPVRTGSDRKALAAALESDVRALHGAAHLR